MEWFWYDNIAIFFAFIGVVGVIFAALYAAMAVKSGFSEMLTGAAGVFGLVFLCIVAVTLISALVFSSNIKSIMYVFSFLGLFPIFMLGVLYLPIEKLIDKGERDKRKIERMNNK